ncbi:DUF3024 domain-containing protein [Roseibium marinum]|uniref:DUF3024 domain-containing protein n=1 Tax=Roseibium marinum TaxID=281252 RepID=A0A2S3V1L7_9HYPH|nr:DUF3024 domain-containing protein [Roseibium marinum]POF33871.1 Protein of unknown function (DUF3024) [Roseibium marinum]
MQVAALNSPSQMPAAQPNEFDLRRIERALQDRVRYRYVTPAIIGVSGGYRIQAPCCSRNVDPEGGIVDIALLLFNGLNGEWRLFVKDHTRQSWELHSAHSRLQELLDDLKADPNRVFWQ